ncbi:TetR/AcrR family transcriptional regulator [Amphritea pacifica]|uniref:TetR/AcrR family transcriptional regulator n=1 Tax=Amphritea pacifica TaxID=2811233 RepID=A0ABS2W7F9_9GAMM|nr:TetR/AcrR family transcriptional regulator [Amphritea pacifica]MBN0987647.1 TetR/AcrR family transcriptional regulator [Amphritea pacifica]MBN1009061.1 TetR/AcrR family transcriptional regulator [Amphritea pacifica]
MTSKQTGGASKNTVLTAKKRPEQQRGADTYELILEVAAQMLGEVGIERLSTNQICAQAGLTPPALYRYFPNKYALLSELGQRLMKKQNELIPLWITSEVLCGSTAALEKALEGLLIDTYRVTRDTPGGVWILRALRAVPSLQKVRLDSHEVVTKAQGELLKEAFPDVSAEELALAGRIVVDMIYAAVEMLLDLEIDERPVASIVAAMIASYPARLRATGE